MAKLNISVDLNVKTNRMQITDEDSLDKIFLSGKKASAFFSKVPTEELAFEVVSTNKGAEASFPVFLKNGKKDAIFDVHLIDGGDALEARISGNFSFDLRSGVAPMLKELTDKLDLRVRGVMWKGGSYNGFMASVAGGDFAQDTAEWATTFPRVTSFNIK